MRALSGLMEPTGGGRGHDLFLIFGRVDNVNTPRRAQLELGAPLHNPYGQNESCCRTAAIPAGKPEQFTHEIRQRLCLVTASDSSFPGLDVRNQLLSPSVASRNPLPIGLRITTVITTM